MNKFTWNDARLSTGLKSIDHQHQLFVKNFNDIADLVNWGKEDLSEYSAHIKRLLDDLKQHFQDEEKILHAAASPSLAHHTTEHERLCTLLEQSLHQAETLEQILELLKQIFSWMEVHLPLEADEFRQLATPTRL